MTQNGNFTKLKGSNSYETNNSKLLLGYYGVGKSSLLET